MKPEWGPVEALDIESEGPTYVDAMRELRESVGMYLPFLQTTRLYSSTLKGTHTPNSCLYTLRIGFRRKKDV